MKYYIVNLSIHVLMVLALTVVIIIFSNRNKRRETKHVLSYFVPTILAVCVAFYVCFITGPRLLDMSDVATQNYYSYTGQIEEIALFNNSFTIDGVRYYINPLRDLPREGSKVRISYTRYSNYVISVEPVDEVDVTGVINEELETAVNIPG